MVVVETVAPASAGPVAAPGGPLSYIHWGPGIAGAIVATATSFVLMGFASAVGLMVASPSPTWRDTSVWLAVLSGFWIIVVAVGSFALGGYLAGRVRSTWSAPADEVEFRDGTHGLIAWALGVMLGAILLALTANTFAAGSAASPPRDTAGAPELPRLRDRSAVSRRAHAPSLPRRWCVPKPRRLVMKGLGRSELPAEDRSQLTRLTAARHRTGPARCGQACVYGAQRCARGRVAGAAQRRSSRVLPGRRPCGGGGGGMGRGGCGRSASRQRVLAAAALECGAQALTDVQASVVRATGAFAACCASERNAAHLQKAWGHPGDEHRIFSSAASRPPRKTGRSAMALRNMPEQIASLPKA